MTSSVGLRSDRKRPAAAMGGKSSKQSYDLTADEPQGEIPTQVPQTDKSSAYVRNTNLLPPPDPKVVEASLSRQSSAASQPPRSPTSVSPTPAATNVTVKKEPVVNSTPAPPISNATQPTPAASTVPAAVSPTQQSSTAAPTVPAAGTTTQQTTTAGSTVTQSATASSIVTPAQSTTTQPAVVSSTTTTTTYTTQETTAATLPPTAASPQATAESARSSAVSDEYSEEPGYSTIPLQQTTSVEQAETTVQEKTEVSHEQVINSIDPNDTYATVVRMSATGEDKTTEPSIAAEPAVSLMSTPSDPKVVSTESGMDKTVGDQVDNVANSEHEGDPEVEAEVCNVSDLKDGEMKEVEVGDGKALLVKDNGEFHAVGHKCTHYGAPLVKGAYCNGRVRCPWHGACFNVATGDIEDFPGLDSLQKFDVRVEGDKVKVKARKSTLTTLKRVKHMSVSNAQDDTRVFLIIGSGGAGNACAETLRQEGFKGKIIIATKEGSLPYDRPKLSKAMTSTAEDLQLRNKDFYEWSDITVSTNKEAVDLNVDSKEVSFQDGEKIKFDKLFIATGGTPRSLPTPGADLENVCILRTPSDANRIAGLAKDKNVVIIGTSFIGMEVASCIAETAKSLSTVDLVEVPFKLVLGEEVGLALQKLHEEKGTTFYLGQSAKEFIGEDGKLTEIVLQDDTRLPADLCVIGIGVFPTTQFLKSSGLDISERGFINVDKQMATNKADIFAGGDIVNFPLFINNNEHSNVQHWQMSHQHGRIAALNMLGKSTEIKSVPFFWTVQFGKSVRYTGFGLGYDDIVIHGDLDELKFIAYYTKGHNVIAVASLNYDPYVAKAAEFMMAGKVITKDEIKDDPVGWEKRY